MKKQTIINTDFLDLARPLFAGERRCEKEHSFGPCVRDYWLLHCVISGKGVYKVQNASFEVTQGQSFVIKPGEVTLYTADKKCPWHYVWMAFKVKDCHFDLPYIIENKRLYKTMESLSVTVGCSEASHYRYVSAFYEILDCLSVDIAEKAKNPVDRAISMIEQQYMTSLTVGYIARCLGFDRSYFSNLFKARTGKSPMQYLADYRMKTALTMLCKEKYSVSVVANSVGYSDVFGFSRYFKRYYGVSPKNYAQIKDKEK